MAVLESVGAYEATTARYHSPIEPEKVAEMLIHAPAASPLDPLSATRSAIGLARHQRHGPGSYANEAERLTGKVLERLRYDRIDEILQQGLHDYLTELIRMCGLDWAGDRAHLFLLCGGGMNRYHLLHSTEFIYDGAVSESYNEVRLRPIHDDRKAAFHSGW